MKQFLIACLVLLAACNNESKYDIDSKDKYENSKEALMATEKKNAARFITVKGNNKKNLIGQTVIKGTIYNSAKIVTYKDIDIKLAFYSKTGALLEEDHEIVYETVAPGGSKTFKSKYFTPRGTDSVAFTVIAAKF
ncbi:MAG: hypothetical protein EOO88_57185 [Pedobacter sp.]|nr:MAG: hypothetical protein EOO88_57185 [Pedobacter sp.]